MRDVGLAVAMLIVLAGGWRLMGKLDGWLRSGRIRDADDEARQEDHPNE